MAASDSSYIQHRKLNKVIQEPDWPLVSFETKNHSILLTLIHIHSFYHSLSFAVTHCHFCYSLSFVVTRVQSLTFFATCCTTRFNSLSPVVPLIVTLCHLLCHSLSLVVTRCHSLHHSFLFLVTRCHSLSLDVPLTCLFINDQMCPCRQSLKVPKPCFIICPLLQFLQLRIQNFIGILLRHGCSPVNLLHICRTPFPKNASAGTASKFYTILDNSLNTLNIFKKESVE